MNETPFIYLAPLEGCTEFVFRNIFSKHFYGLDAAIAPFVSLNHHAISEKNRKWDIPHNDLQGMKTIPQFMGRNVKSFYQLVEWLKNKGYDEINWNLGCPSKRVVKKGRGSGQLQYPDEIKQFLDEVLPNIDIGLSIKTRLGFENPDECFKLFELYNQYPIKEIVLHPRLGKQMYSGEVNLDYFEECLRLSKNELVYNGDIKTANDFEMIRKRFPSVKRFMIGRGLIKDPFLAEKIKGLIDPEAAFDKDRFINFHEELFDSLDQIFWNKHELMGKMKEYWLSFSYLFNDRNTVSKYVVRSKDIEELYSRIKEILK